MVDNPIVAKKIIVNSGQSAGPWYLYRVRVMMLIGPLSQLLLWLQTETQTMAGSGLELSTDIRSARSIY